MKNEVTGTFLNKPDPQKIIKAFDDVGRTFMGWTLTVTPKPNPGGNGTDTNEKPITA